MSEDLLKQIFQEVYEQEFAQFENGKQHRFSRRHKKQMKAMFAEFTDEKIKKKRRKRHIMTAVLVAAATAFLGATAVGVGYKYKIIGVYPDHTEVVFNNTSGPETIEEIYCLPNPPEGFHLYEYAANAAGAGWTYFDENLDKILSFEQGTKRGTKMFPNTEKYDIVHTYVGECEGYYMDFGEYGAVLTWVAEDYVFSLEGDFSVGELMEWAKTICVDPNAEYGYWCEDE